MSAETSLPLHGGQLHRIAERFGVPVTGLLDFSANINPDGPSPLAIEALRHALKDPATLTAYPDLEETRLRLAISNYAGVAPANIIVANGFVPLLDAALRVFPVSRCLVPVPAFNEYRRALERAGVALTPYLLDQTDNFSYRPESLLQALRSGAHDSILLANPQNPSGILCDHAVLRDFLGEAAKLNIFVFLDEAFIDYAAASSMVMVASQASNLMVFRSVTKFHAVPGLRVAYAVAHDSTIRKIQDSLAPWTITTLAAIAVGAALKDTAYAKRALKRNCERRQELIGQFESIGLKTYPAAANFVLIQCLSDREAEDIWRELISGYGMVVRNCANFEGLSHNHLRCAVLGSEENSRLVEAFARILNRRRS